MALIGNLNIRIGASIDGLQRGLRRAERSMNRSAKKMTNMGQRLSMTLSTSIGLAGVAAVRTAAEFETLQNGLNILTGSVEEGTRAFERLKEFSARTPFQLQDLTAANNILMGFGLNADTAFDSLEQMGNIAAIMGSDFNRLAINFGQVSAAGVAMTRDIREFINNGVPMWDLLSEATGKTTAELQEMATKQEITFELIQKAFEKATTEGGKFYKGLEKGSKTLSGVFSTMKDNISLALGTIGQSIAETLNLREVAIKIGQSMKSLADRFASLSTGTKRFIVIAAALAAAIGPLLIAFGSLVTLLSLVPAGLGGMIGIAGLVTASIIAVTAAVIKLNAEYQKVNGLSKRVNKRIEQQAATYLKEKENIDKLRASSNNLSLSLEQRQKAYDTLVDQYPDYFKSMKIEEGQIVDVVSKYDELIAKIKDVARQRAISKTMTELEQKKLDLEIEISAKYPGLTIDEIQKKIEHIAKESNNTFGKRLKNNLREALQQLNIVEDDWLMVENQLDEINALNREINKLANMGGVSLIDENNLNQAKNLDQPKASTGENVAADIYDDFIAEQKKLNNLLKAERIDVIEFRSKSFDLANKALDELVANGYHASNEFKKINKFLFAPDTDRALDMPKIETATFERSLDDINKIFAQQIEQNRERIRQENEWIEENYVSTFGRIANVFGEFGNSLLSMNNPMSQMFGALFTNFAQLQSIDFSTLFDRFKLGFKDIAKDVQTMTHVIGQSISIIAQSVANGIQEQMSSLDASYQQQINQINALNISENAKQRQRLAAEKKYNRQVAEMKKRQARANKVAAISQTISNGAVAIMKAFAELGPIGGAIATGIITGVTAAQIGTINSQPIPQFANGGIVSGRTLAEVGEYGSASRGNPEVIAPLNKLKSMLSDMGSNNITGEFRLRGDDLVAAVDQANRKTGRFSGKTQF